MCDAKDELFVKINVWMAMSKTFNGNRRIPPCKRWKCYTLSGFHMKYGKRLLLKGSNLSPCQSLMGVVILMSMLPPSTHKWPPSECLTPWSASCCLEISKMRPYDGTRAYPELPLPTIKSRWRNSYTNSQPIDTERCPPLACLGFNKVLLSL